MLLALLTQLGSGWTTSPSPDTTHTCSPPRPAECSCAAAMSLGKGHLSGSPLKAETPFTWYLKAVTRQAVFHVTPIGVLSAGNTQVSPDPASLSKCGKSGGAVHHLFTVSSLLNSSVIA